MTWLLIVTLYIGGQGIVKQSPYVFDSPQRCEIARRNLDALTHPMETDRVKFIIGPCVLKGK